VKSIGRVKVLGLLALPVLALAVAVMILSWGHNTSTTAQAVDEVAFSIDVNGCTDAKCDVDENSAFDVNVYLDDISGLPTGAYDALAATVAYTGVTSNGRLDIVWPDCAFEANAPGAGFENAGCSIGIGAPSSTFTGLIATGSFQCDVGVSGSVSLTHGAADTLVIGSDSVTYTESGPDAINVNCVPPPPTPTPTATPTPAPQSPIQKLPALQNQFLERQGAKIPPQTCLLGNDAGELAETMAFWAPDVDPKNPEALQELGAFEFEVHFDADKVCVVLTPGPAITDAICLIEDATNSQLEGVARMGCVSQGKDTPMAAEDGLVLANILVRPQPDVYSQAKPNQDNGVVVQINNVGCELADLQGHPIPIFSCEDADITYRYLEGDVSADCSVDAIDTQSIAFRWGAEKGSLIYTDFMNLEPSGTQADADIDIKDLQFVFGRFGSTCDVPWPAQEPVNPKG
jgi:hypothetical protein